MTPLEIAMYTITIRIFETISRIEHIIERSDANFKIVRASCIGVFVMLPKYARN